MIGVRCSADGQSFGSGTIQMLSPGQMGSVICDMQAPDGDDSIIIEAEVDRGTNVDEVDETNNVESKTIAIGAPLQDVSSTEEDDSFEIGQETVYIIAGVVLLMIIALFGFLAPPKIRNSNEVVKTPGLTDNRKIGVNIHMRKYSELDTSHGLWGLFTIGDEVECGTHE